MAKDEEAAEEYCCVVVAGGWAWCCIEACGGGAEALEFVDMGTCQPESGELCQANPGV